MQYLLKSQLSLQNRQADLKIHTEIEKNQNFQNNHEKELSWRTYISLFQNINQDSVILA